MAPWRTICKLSCRSRWIGVLILPNDEGARRELAAGLTRDRAQQSYDSATRKLVSIFQELRRLPVTAEQEGNSPRLESSWKISYSTRDLTEFTKLIPSGLVSL